MRPFPSLFALALTTLPPTLAAQPHPASIPPDTQRLQGGQALITWLRQAAPLESLSPAVLKQHFGLRLEKRDQRVLTGDVPGRHLTYGASPLPAGASDLSYVVGWHFRANNGERLSLRIDAATACITEESLFAAMGGRGTPSQSTMRTFAAGRTPPPGLRPTRDSFMYALAGGVKAYVSFDYLCADEIRLSVDRSAHWQPEASVIGDIE